MDKTIYQLEAELEAEIDHLYELMKCGIIYVPDYERRIEDIKNYYNKLIDDIVTNYYN